MRVYTCVRLFVYLPLLEVPLGDFMGCCLHVPGSLLWPLAVGKIFSPVILGLSVKALNELVPANIFLEFDVLIRGEFFCV